MAGATLGDLIREKREQRGFTQQELCDGICDQKTLSRIERNATTPSFYVVEALAQRLAISLEENYYRLFKNGAEIADLRDKITAAQQKYDYDAVNNLLDEFEKVVDMDNRILRQFVLSKRASCAKDKSNEERVAMFLGALQCTVSGFNMEHMTQSFFSLEECRIIINMANEYSYSDTEKTISILYQLYNIVKVAFEDVREYDAINVLICTHIVQPLIFEERYHEAVLMADAAIRHMVKYNRIHMLGEMMSQKAFALFYLGSKDECVKLYKKSLLIMEICDSPNIITTKKRVKKYLDIDLDEL